MNPRVSFLTTILILSELTLCQAQEIAVPVEVQVPLFLKILTYERNLEKRAGPEIVIGIIHQRKFRKSLVTRDQFISAVKKLPAPKIGNIPFSCVPIDLSDEVDLNKIISKEKIDLLYIAPLRATGLEPITAASRALQLTTLTGVPEYVESGLALGIGTRGGRPQILVNLSAAKAEGADFNSQLLKMARIIDRIKR